MSQPDDAGWVYAHCGQCVGATFVRDVYRTQTLWGSAVFATKHFEQQENIPPWLFSLITLAHQVANERQSDASRLTFITAPILRECWHKLFPEPVAEPEPLTNFPALSGAGSEQN